MAAQRLSMFDVDPSLSIADQAQQQSAAAMQYARLDPMQQATYNDSMANAGLAAGVGELGRVGMAAAQGQDPRNPQQKMAAVKAQIAQALQGKDVSNPEVVYPVVIQSLQAAGLVPQAMAAAREFEEIVNKRRDDARATAKDEASAKNAAARTAILQRGGPVQQMLDRMKVNKQRISQLDPADPEVKRLMDENSIIEEHLNKQNIQVRDAGDRLVTYIDGVPTSEVVKGSAPPKLTANVGSGAGNEGLDEAGTLQNGQPIMRGKKTGLLYVYNGAEPERYEVTRHGPWNKKETEAEARARVLGGAMSAGASEIDNATAMPGATRLKTYFGLDGSPVRQMALYSTFSDQEKQYISAVRQFLNGNLRYESGAAVPESEYPKYMDALIPFDGDSPQLKAQKKAARENIARLVTRSGPPAAGGNALPGRDTPSAAPAAPAAPAQQNTPRTYTSNWK